MIDVREKARKRISRLKTQEDDEKRGPKENAKKGK